MSQDNVVKEYIPEYSRGTENLHCEPCPECDGTMLMHSHRIYYTTACVTADHWHCHSCGDDFTYNLTKLTLDELGCVMMLDVGND